MTFRKLELIFVSLISPDVVKVQFISFITSYARMMRCSYYVTLERLQNNHLVIKSKIQGEDPNISYQPVCKVLMMFINRRGQLASTPPNQMMTIVFLAIPCLTFQESVSQIVIWWDDFPLLALACSPVVLQKRVLNRNTL